MHYTERKVPGGASVAGDPLGPPLLLAEHFTLAFGPSYSIKITVNAINLVPKRCSRQQEETVPPFGQGVQEAASRPLYPSEATRRFLSRDKHTPDRMADSSKTRNGTQNNTEKYFIRKFRDS